MTAPKAGESYRNNSKKKDVRTSNIEAAKAVADSVRTSLGPRGMDKMVRWQWENASLAAGVTWRRKVRGTRL